MAPACRVAALLTTARFTGLIPTLPEKIGTVVRPVTLRYPLRHRPLWDGGEDWEIPTGADGVLLRMERCYGRQVYQPFVFHCLSPFGGGDALSTGS
jgi:hypothetical protein